MPAIMPDAIYTVHQVAEILHCSGRQVYRYIEQGLLRAKHLGKQTLVRGRDLLAFFEGLADADGNHDTDEAGD